MATVSFFCTRCRRLTTFPASRRGAIVYCPRCQQALIAPDIPTTEDGEEGENEEFAQDGALATIASLGGTGENDAVPLSGEEERKEAAWEAPTRRFGATIASHLTPGKERSENWRRVEAGASNGTSGELDDASLLTRTEVSDAEFLRRLRSEPQAQSVAQPPLAPPVLLDVAQTQKNAETGRILKLVWGGVGVAALGSAFVVGAFWAGNAKRDGVVNPDAERVAKGGVFVEGALTYRTANGTNAPDDGAFVFLFPSEERFGAPIALGDVK